MNRRVSQPLFVGDVKIGGDSPISVQSMTKTDTRDIKSTVDQIKRLEEVGCQIIRCAVPDMEAAKSLKSIKSEINIPLVADIHFHYQLALEALNSGADCLRLNPGNIRDKDRVTQIASEGKQSTFFSKKGLRGFVKHHLKPWICNSWRACGACLEVVSATARRTPLNTRMSPG